MASLVLTAIDSGKKAVTVLGAAEAEAVEAIEVAHATTERAASAMAATETTAATVSRGRRADPASRTSPNPRQRNRSLSSNLSPSNKSMRKKKNGLK